MGWKTILYGVTRMSQVEADRPAVDQPQPSHVGIGGQLPLLARPARNKATMPCY